MNTGWKCPECGRVYAPHVDECRYCNTQAKAPDVQPVWPDPWVPYVPVPTYPHPWWDRIICRTGTASGDSVPVEPTPVDSGVSGSASWTGEKYQVVQ